MKADNVPRIFMVWVLCQQLMQLDFCLHFLTSSLFFQITFFNDLSRKCFFSFSTYKLIALRKPALIWSHIDNSKFLPFLRIGPYNMSSIRLQFLRHLHYQDFLLLHNQHLHCLQPCTSQLQWRFDLWAKAHTFRGLWPYVWIQMLRYEDLDCSQLIEY